MTDHTMKTCQMILMTQLITDYGNTTINFLWKMCQRLWRHNRNLLWKHVNNFGGNEYTKRGQHPHIVRQGVERGLPVQDPQPLVTGILTHRDLQKQF